jgi:hypothetical protein
MDGEHQPKGGEIENNGSLDGAETSPDELVEIDPADFIDPNEFGFKHPSLTENRLSGCLWCKKRLLTHQAMIEHHARHCSEDIARDNEKWKLTPPHA